MQFMMISKKNVLGTREQLDQVFHTHHHTHPNKNVFF